MKLGAIPKIGNNLSHDTALSLYKSLLLPHFYYSDTIYCCTSVNNLNTFQILQNAACRSILLADFETHIAEMHSFSQLLYIENKRDLDMACLCHKSIYFSGLLSLSQLNVRVVLVVGRYTRVCNTMKMNISRMQNHHSLKTIRDHARFSILEYGTQ